MLIPRWYQTESDDAFWNHLCTQPGNPIEVLPTGAGKSLVIAMHCQKAVEKFKGRVIVLAHRKELLIQNAEKIKALLPGMDIGIYSAGLKARDVNHDIILAGIQSVYDKAHLFGQRNLGLVDEVHLVGEEGMYNRFFGDLRKLNPNLRIGGLTATPFRTGEGKVTGPNRLFQAICYCAPIMRLIEEGYLSRLVVPQVDNSVDTSKLHIRAGEFKSDEMEELFAGEEKINSVCMEILSKTIDRRSTLIFCPSVFHAQATRKKIEELTGEECGLVIGDSPPMERAATLSRFKNQTIKRCVNVDVLTTGFDAPGVDCVAVLRATMSACLFMQICGRGLRTAPGKENCLILDFGENCKRHGPLDSDKYGLQDHQTKRGDGTGDAPTKTCPSCGLDNPISTKVCECGWKFPLPEIAKHGVNADGSPIFEADIVPEVWTVIAVNMGRHRKKGNDGSDPDTLRIDYTCQPNYGGLEERTISEWVCLEHEGFAQKKAALWWLARSIAPMPDIDGAIDLWKRGAVASPTTITTRPEGRFVKIVSVELDEKPTEWREPSDEREILDAFDEYDEVPF